VIQISLQFRCDRRLAVILTSTSSQPYRFRPTRRTNGTPHVAS